MVDNYIANFNLHSYFLFIIIHLELKDNQLLVPQKSEEIVRGGPEQSQDKTTIAHSDKQNLKKSQVAVGKSFNEQSQESKNYNNQTKLNLYADSKLLNRFIFNYSFTGNFKSAFLGEIYPINAWNLGESTFY